MHFHLTSPQLLVGAFAIALGLIFALARVLQFRLEKAHPFRNDFRSETDPSRFARDSFSRREEMSYDERTFITDFGFRYTHSPKPRVRAQNAMQRMRE
jgi:hypothetical protein